MTFHLSGIHRDVAQKETDHHLNMCTYLNGNEQSGENYSSHTESSFFLIFYFRTHSETYSDLPMLQDFGDKHGHNIFFFFFYFI